MTPFFLPGFGKPLPDSWQNTGKEFLHRASDFNRVRLEREMSGIEESNFRGGNIAFVGLGTSRQKERIIATPHRKQRWLVFTKVGLKLRIERDIAGVVAEQIKLYLV